MVRTVLLEFALGYRRFFQDESSLWQRFANRDEFEDLPPSSALKAIVDETITIVRHTASEIARAGYPYNYKDVIPRDRLLLLAEHLSQRKDYTDLVQAARIEELEGELAELRETVLLRHEWLQPYLEALQKGIVQFSEEG